MTITYDQAQDKMTQKEGFDQGSNLQPFGKTQLFFWNREIS